MIDIATSFVEHVFRPLALVCRMSYLQLPLTNRSSCWTGSTGSRDVKDNKSFGMEVDNKTDLRGLKPTSREVDLSFRTNNKHKKLLDLALFRVISLD